MEHSKDAQGFFELFITVRKEIATDNGYHLASAIMLCFDRWNNGKNTKDILAAQREIIQGYYFRIFNQKPELEAILQWLESDLEYLSMEDAVEGVKDIVMNYQKP